MKCCKGHGSCKVSVEEVRGRMGSYRVLSVVMIVVGIVSVSFGIPTVIYAAPNPANPFTSGSGIFTGVSSVLSGIFGMLLMKEVLSEKPSKARCLVVAVRMFLQVQMTVGGLHLGYSIWSCVVCFSGDGGTTCGGEHRSALSLLGVYSSIVGLAIFVMGILAHVFAWKIFNAAWSLGKRSEVEMVSA
ncbi:uncharacterized protein LOC124280639 isoform X2 [Haliotis rubra]|uniref:uncharacterized protein LOC124280639 isoform X2 n=1 Tax=Haliotis rubra TaxID=36100 RepID=UPI001EE52E26|nr:uncharacterized protein LOC124280639 isoform X2 [Haliotis rubra]